VVAHDDALGERFVHRHAQAPAQFRQAHQQQAQAPLGVVSRIISPQMCRIIL
jgi:hypothetical protein